MLENILYTLSDISILFGVLMLLCGRIFGNPSHRFCFSVSKTVVLISAMFAVLFYNKNILEEYFETSVNTTIVFVLTCAMVFVWLFLASKWYAGNKEHGFTKFCALALMLLLNLKMMIETTHLGVLLMLTTVFVLLQYLLFTLNKYSEELYHTGRRYLLISVLFLIFFGGAILFFGWDKLGYLNMTEYLAQTSVDFQIFVLCSIICMLLFLLGAAPFHFWLADQSVPIVLPVATYFALIPMLCLWFLFLKINQTVLVNLGDTLGKIYFVFGLVSVVFGVIGANSSHFIRKIFSSTSLYQTGVLLIVLSSDQTNVMPYCFMYMEAYMLVLLGVYICFYMIKINGEYPSNLSLLKGLSSSRPFISAVFVFLIFVLMGLPPFSLFLTEFMTLMGEAKHAVIIYTILVGAVMFVPAYLKMVQTIGFLPREQNFDRIDFSLYLCLLLYMVVFIYLSMKPQYFLMQETLLKGVL